MNKYKQSDYVDEIKNKFYDYGVKPAIRKIVIMKQIDRWKETMDKAGKKMIVFELETGEKLSLKVVWRLDEND